MMRPEAARTGVVKVFPSSLDLVTNMSATVLFVPILAYATYRSPDGSTAGWLNWSRSWSTEAETMVCALEKVWPRSRDTASLSFTVLPTLPLMMSHVE